MLSWAQLVAAPVEQRIPREPSVQRALNRHMRKLAKRGVTAGQHITKTLIQPNELYVLAPNPFPYWLEPNIRHMVLWFNPAFEDLGFGSTRTWVEETVRLKMMSVQKIHVVENLPHNRSVPELRHIHVFLLMR